ncbi:MAG: hypothetical protein ACE5GE_15670, partial [Phycisphaerae bacterium]
MRQALGAVSLALLIATSATAQVRWRSGHSPRSGASRQQVGATIANSQLRGGGRHLVVQFDRPVSLETRATLNQNGLELLGYLGDNAFFAAVSPDGANPAALAAVDALVDAVPIQVPNKLHATLARGQLPDWAVVPLPVERMDDPAAANQVWIAAYILFHADVATNQALAAVGAYRAVVRTRLRSVNGMVLELPFDAVNALASEDAVQYLE